MSPPKTTQQQIVDILGSGYRTASEQFKAVLVAQNVDPKEADKLIKGFNETFSGFIGAAGAAAKSSAVAITLDFFTETIEKRLPSLNTYLTQVETAQKSFNQTIGIEGAAALKSAKDAFIELNKSVEKGGFNFSTFTDTYKEFIAATKFAPVGKFGDNFIEVSKKIAESSQVIDKSKLIGFTKNIGLQMGTTATDAEKMGEQLVEMAYQAGLPVDTFLNLNQSLLNSNVVFGSSTEEMRRLAVQTEAFGRSIGTTGEAVSKQLSSLMTIQGRTQFAGRLSQIASQVGAEVDIRAIMSSDPAEQERGIRASLQSFSRAYQRLQTPAQRRALGLVLQRAYNLPADAIRTALTQGLNTEAALQKFEQARKAAAGGIRDETKRAFVTLKESIDGMKTAYQLQAGAAQLKELNKALDKLNTNTDKQSNEIKKFNKNIGGLADKISGGVKGAIEKFTEVAQDVVNQDKSSKRRRPGSR